VARLVAQEGDGEPGLHEGLGEAAHDLGGRVVQPSEDPHEPGGDVVGAQVAAWGVVPGHAEQVVALVQGKMQTPGDRGEHRLGRLRPALLFEAAVVVGRHAAQRGDLLAPQAADAPARAAWEPDVLGLQRLPPGAEEVRQLCSVHVVSLSRAGVTRSRATAGCLPTPRRAGR
jgi:hypothetical protein